MEQKTNPPPVAQVAYDLLADSAPRISGSSNVPPASPKRRRGSWDPPALGTTYVRDQDGSIWRLYQLDRASRQACLIANVGGYRKWVAAGDLEREWTEVGS